MIIFIIINITIIIIIAIITIIIIIIAIIIIAIIIIIITIIAIISMIIIWVAPKSNKSREVLYLCLYDCNTKPVHQYENLSLSLYHQEKCKI